MTRYHSYVGPFPSTGGRAEQRQHTHLCVELDELEQAVVGGVAARRTHRIHPVQRDVVLCGVVFGTEGGTGGYV